MVTACMGSNSAGNRTTPLGGLVSLKRVLFSLESISSSER